MYQILVHMLEYSREETERKPCPHKISILVVETKYDKITYGTVEENEC